MQQALFLKPDSIRFPQTQTEEQKSWLSLSAHKVGGPLPLPFVLINTHILLQDSISNHSFLIIIAIDRNIATALQKGCKQLSKTNPTAAYGNYLGLLLFLRKNRDLDFCCLQRLDILISFSPDFQIAIPNLSSET